jgi:hypothetical protein
VADFKLPQPPPFQAGVADMDSPTTQDVQAQAEGVGDDAQPGTIEFLGERFRVAENVGPMALAKFSNAARKGLESDDQEGLASMYLVIRSIIHRPPLFGEDGKRLRDDATGKPLRDESEWLRFEELAIDENASDEDLMGAVQDAIEVISARPTQRRANSSGTSPTTSENSRGSSSSRATNPAADGMTPVAQLGR